MADNDTKYALLEDRIKRLEKKTAAQEEEIRTFRQYVSRGRGFVIGFLIAGSLISWAFTSGKAVLKGIIGWAAGS